MNMMPVLDRQGSTHTLALSSVGIMLDGKPCRLLVRDASIELLSVDPEIGVVAVTAAALWHALAGDDPTAEDAGMIQSQALANFAALQEIGRLAGQVRLLLDEIDRQVHQNRQPPLPPYRFSPFVCQLLATLDGSEEQTLAVARILKQSPQIICEWGAQVGKTISLPLAEMEDQPSSISATRQADVQQPVVPPSPDVPEKEEELTGGRRGKRGFPWTDEHERLLEEAFDSSQQESINARTREIAARFDWPFHVVDYRLRLLHGKRKAMQREAVTQPLQEDDQVEAQPITRSPAEKVEMSRDPVSLPLGPFLWDVKIDEQMRRWQLDIVYGQFPHQAGTHFMYREQEYVLVRVWNSMIAATRATPAGEWVEEGSAALQMAAVSQRPRLVL